MTKPVRLILKIVAETSEDLLSIIEGKNTYRDRKQLGLLIKFLNDQYVKDFIKGRLYLKNIEYFNKIEQRENFPLREDDLEGVSASFDPVGATDGRHPFERM
ncbi:hypothetical protein [uncultured Legionella sp.]|uniref:hypothetical protein n=1 Tax=uncultured Legionella sp. TaxID=210934 RepID=UPI00261EF345|nr:hypothetical protein [uncultured Legionella sp.]